MGRRKPINKSALNSHLSHVEIIVVNGKVRGIKGLKTPP